MARLQTDIRFADMPKDYEQLCLDVGFPRAIHTKADHRVAVELCRTMAGHKLTADQREYRALVIHHIAEYEKTTLKHLDTDSVSGIDALRYLMENSRLNQTDIAGFIGKDSSVVSKILHGHRKIQADEAIALGERFSVNPTVFLVVAKK